MRKVVRILVVSALMFLPAVSFAGEKFDGNWLTTLTCPAKGNTEGYTWKFPGVVTAGNFRGEHGTADQPGYLLITGPIADDGSAKLSASGIVVWDGRLPCPSSCWRITAISRLKKYLRSTGLTPGISFMRRTRNR